MRSIVLVLATVAALAAGQCTKDFGNATFDLTKLRVPNGAYFVKDNRANNIIGYNNYTYIFNVCDDVNLNNLPSPDITAACMTTHGSNNQLTTTNAAAFQFAYFPVPANDKCHRLSSDIDAYPNNETWALIDPTNPSRGVQVTYEGGDLCCTGNTGNCNDPVHRALTLQFYCYDDVANSFDSETVLETSTCKYSIWLDTSFGCPTTCSIVNGHLCAGHGICDFDTVLGQPRCFCNQGWQGASCADQIPPPATGLSTAGAVVIVVSVLLAGLMGVLFWLWQKIRGLRLDPNAYKSLTGGPEGEAGGIYDD